VGLVLSLPKLRLILWVGIKNKMRQLIGMNIRHMLVVAAAVVLSSCASYQLDEARDMTPTGDAFTQALYDAYLTHSARAFEEDNEELSNAFAARAIAAAKGTVVAPVVPVSDALQPGSASVGNFDTARSRLLAALATGRSVQPVLSAQAQGAYDCWYLRSIDPDSDAVSVTRCRSEFDSALIALEAAITPPAPVVVLPEGASFTSYFGFDEWFLRAEALDVIGAAMDTARAGGHGEIVLGGHADTSGPADYNDGLSLRRAEAVKATMVELGALPEAIKVIAYGETQLAVPTPDGVREPLNRRVEIQLVP
jgi:outer membrane protein OmpA-like peptidoglycan-associated protein